MEACACTGEELDVALAQLRAAYAPGCRGMELKEVAGGLTFATSPEAEDAARKLLSKPRTPPLTPAQAETLSIIAYLQPVSRPEITRIRGVSADSASGTLLERGLIEEAGRSPFGAILYRTSALFLKLFGLASLKDLPDVTQWDPTPEETADLRERLLRAGEARSGIPAAPAQPGVAEEEDTAAVEQDELPAPTPVPPRERAPLPAAPAPFGGGPRLVPVPPPQADGESDADAET
jgi:segregation and condensation protein B